MIFGFMQGGMKKKVINFGRDFASADATGLSGLPGPSGGHRYLMCIAKYQQIKNPHIMDKIKFVHNMRKVFYFFELFWFFGFRYGFCL